MAELTLEQRVAVLEQEVAALKGKSAAPANGKWWEQVGRPMRPELEAAFDRMLAYGQYFRKTGREAPPDWKPGDPIPEAEEGAP